MSRLSTEIWTKLANERIIGEALWARRACPDVTGRVIAALGEDGQRHILIKLAQDEEVLQDLQSRGVSVITRELIIPDHEAGQYLDIRCHDSSGHEAFDIIGGEIADRLAAARETAPEIVSRVLSKWRRFWGQLPRQMLSKQEQQGLFAELWFLSTWLLRYVSATDAVNRWRGPKGERHDFQWAECAVEVKSTSSTRGRIHHINGLDQLAPPTPGALFFFSLSLREEPSSSHSLPQIITSCRGLLAESPEALETFEGLLAQTGYSPTYEDEYAKLRLRVAAEGLYRVADDFPRLTAESFPDGLSSGIEWIEYEINLTGFGHLLVAAAVDALPPDLFESADQP